jgi:MFS family permease
MPSTYWILFASQVVNRMGGMVVPFLALYLAGEGLTAGEVGAVVAGYGLGAVAGRPAGGLLADRLGRRATMLLGLTATAACLPLLAVAGTVTVATAAAVALGVVGSLPQPAAYALVADGVAGPARSRAFGMLHWAHNIGAAVAGGMAGFLAGRGYGLLFALNIAAALVCVALLGFGLPRDRPPRGRAPGAGRSGLADPLLLGLTLLMLGHMLVFAQYRYGLPLAIRDDGLPPSTFGLVSMVNAGLIVGAQPLLVRWLSRFRPLVVVAASWAVFGVGMALTGVADSTPAHLATAVVWTLGEIGAYGFGAAIVADLAPPDAQGAYQGVFGTASGLGMFAGPLAGAALQAGLGASALWWACAAVGLGGAAAALLLVPAVDRRTARRPAAVRA